MNRTAISVFALKSLAGVPGVPDGFNVLLMPWGEFSAMDGRPANVGLKSWVFNEQSASAVLSRFDARKTPMVIDYEHQTVNSEHNGQPAPAAGWIEKLAAVAGVGLVALVAWTDRAKAAITANEYRFVSPVFGFEKATGVVQFLQHAGLVNDPGLSSTAQSVALKWADDDINSQTTTGDRSMSELLVSLRAALGFTAETTADSCLAAVTALKTKADEVNAVSSQIATLKANQFDTAKHVPVETHQAISTELATLKATISKAEQSTLIEELLKAGKLVPAQKAWAETQTVESLKAFTKGAPAVVPGKTQSDGKGAPSGDVDAGDASAVALKAGVYIKEQAALGRVVDAVEAVNHVSPRK